MSKLLPNLPIEDLTSETDYLGIIDKGNLIKFFLESNTDELSEIKMFVLYGEWGSGKSTLMKYLEKELGDSFNAFFFEAWEHEHDSNLSLSLFEYLIDKTKPPREEVSEEIVDIASKLLRGFTKSVKLSIPGLSIDGKQIVEALESEKENSFLQLKEKFKTEFLRWEEFVTKGDNPEYNIIFIDDLDRCEPENVLNLLSALKLFFTYGVKTIFFCGIDKKAVKEAVKTKYGEVVKANEYLEKIFDISFSMPRENEILKLVRNYFPSSSIRQKEIEDNWDYAITNFFKEIKFDNPRRIKKVLNKYLLLKNIKNTQNKTVYVGNIPNIFVRQDSYSNFFETILVLYFIILEEFYPSISDSIFDFSNKKGNYLEALSIQNISPSSEEFTNIENFFTPTYSSLPLKEIKKILLQEEDDMIHKGKFYVCFSPINIRRLTCSSIADIRNAHEIICKQASIDFSFFIFILKNEKLITECNELSELSILQIKNMISKLL